MMTMKMAVRQVRRRLQQLGISINVRVRYSSIGLCAYCSADGVWITIPKCQVVRLLWNADGVYRTIFHEFGHAFAQCYRVRLKKMGIKRIFGDLDCQYPSMLTLFNYRFGIKSEPYISAYAQSHPSEDFAETFAFVVQHGLQPPSVKNKVLQRKLDFMVKVLISK